MMMKIINYDLKNDADNNINGQEFVRTCFPTSSPSFPSSSSTRSYCWNNLNPTSFMFCHVTAAIVFWVFVSFSVVVSVFFSWYIFFWILFPLLRFSFLITSSLLFRRQFVLIIVCEAISLSSSIKVSFKKWRWEKQKKMYLLHKKNERKKERKKN